MDIDTLTSNDYSTHQAPSGTSSRSKSTTPGSARVHEDDTCLSPSLHTKAEEAKKALTYSDVVELNCTMPQVSGCSEVIV